ncbi:MAG: integrase [Methylocystis sp.]|nr:MAG: integrase [Methylocystis sp.]
MARARNKLTTRGVAALSLQPGRHSDGGSLYLVIDGEGATMRRRWLYLFNWSGKRREMGIGGFPAVSLAEARKARDEAERLVRAGRDPIAAREAARREQAGKPTFGNVADAFIEAKSAEWRNEKHGAQWRMTLTKYAAPLRNRPVEQIDTEAVLSVLQPIWNRKPETAARLRGRIEVVLDAARAKGHIPQNDANPARWRGHLDKLLPKRQQLSRGHHPAMSYADVPAFVVKLRGSEAIAAIALEFTILTAARSGEVLGARWAEIEMGARVWTVPASRMKAAREHRVPLSGRAVAVLKKLAEANVGEFVFPGQCADKPLSSMAMEMVLRRMKQDDVTVHGFRSAFRDWAGNETHFPREVAEAALAHVIGDKAEQAYRRGDALEKRRALMEAWAQHVDDAGSSPNVIALRGRA